MDSGNKTKKSPPDLLNKIMNALLTLEQRWDKPGFSVRKIARELCHDYVDDHNLELRIRIELERMAEMGVVVRNSHTKDVWTSSDNLQAVKSKCKKFTEKHCRDGETRDDDGGDVQFVEYERSRDGQQYRDREQPGGNNQYHDGEQLMDQDLQIVEEHILHREQQRLDRYFKEGTSVEQADVPVAEDAASPRQSKAEAGSGMATRTSSLVRDIISLQCLDMQCRTMSQHLVRNFVEKYIVVRMRTGKCTCQQCMDRRAVDVAIVPCKDPVVNRLAEPGVCGDAQGRRQDLETSILKRRRSDDDDAVGFVGSALSTRGDVRKSILKKPKETFELNKLARKDFPAVTDSNTECSGSDCGSGEGWPSDPSPDQEEEDSDRPMTSNQSTIKVMFINAVEDSRPNSSYSEKNYIEDDYLDNSCIIM